MASRVARGDIPTSMASLLGSSRLIALEKPQGGVRPLAIGEGFYRLVSRAIVRLDSVASITAGLVRFSDRCTVTRPLFIFELPGHRL